MFRNTHPRFAPEEPLSIPGDNSIANNKVTRIDAYGLLEKAQGQANEEYKEIMVQRRKMLVRPDGEITGYDIPLVVSLFQNECIMSATHDEFVVMCSKIAELNTWTIGQAQRLYGWTPIKTDPWLMQFLLSHRRLRCFDMLLYVNTGELKYTGDVLVRLLWPNDQLKTNAFNDYLSTVCRRVSEDGRMLMARLFFAAFSIVGSICSYLPDNYRYEAPEEEQKQGRAQAGPSTAPPEGDNNNNNPPHPLLTPKDVKKAIDNVLSLHFNTSTMADQRYGSNIDMVQAFTIISEVTKVFLDDVHVQVDGRRYNALIQQQREAPGPMDLPELVLDTHQIAREVPMYIDCIVSELFAYFYARMDQNETSVEDFVPFCREHHQTLGRRILRDFPNIQQEDPHITEPRIGLQYLEERFNTLLIRIRDGEPAIGELLFSSATLQPVITVSFNRGRELVMNADVRLHLATRLRLHGPRDRGNHIPDGILHNFSPNDFPIYFKQQKKNQSEEQDNVVNQHIQPPATMRDIQGEAHWIATSQFNEKTHYNTNLRERVRPTIEEEDYGLDDIDSDNEHAFEPEEDKVRDDQYIHWDAGDVQEDFYRQVCKWLIHPGDHEKLGHINNNRDEDICNANWFKDFITNGDGKNILEDCTKAPDVNSYVRHWLAYTILSIRGQIVQQLSTDDEFRFMREQPERFLDDLYRGEEHPKFSEVTLDSVNASPHLFHCNASSDDPEFNMEMFENLLGITLCVAYLRRSKGSPRCPIPHAECSRRHNNCSNLFFMIIRKSHMTMDRENCDVDEDGNLIRRVMMRMSFSRDVMRKQGFAPFQEQTIHFLPITSLASQLRVYKSLYRVPLLPPAFLQRLFGETLVKVPYTSREVRHHPSNSRLTEELANAPLPVSDEAMREMIEEQVDPGSLEYLVNCLHHPDCQVDPSHFSALIQSLRCVGAAEPNSSGMCFTQGPPGTGKTNNIVYLIGALLHHSEYGQVDHPLNQQVNFRRVDDGVLRNHNSRRCFKILVVASSNSAVDNILLRIAEEGIPDGKGGVIDPSMIRISKYNYEPPHEVLRQYTVNEASRLYDRNHADRATPSLQAKRRRADEALLFFSTCSAAGGSSFNELNEKPDIVIHDEGANTTEGEALIPIMTTTYEGPQGSIRRTYYLSVGDDYQLEALQHVTSFLRRCRMVKYWKVKSEDLSISLFERMIYHGRAMFSFLSAQYRMHPAISRITSVPFYKLYFRNPLPIGTFLTDYNQVARDNELSWTNYFPLTFIDTSSIPASQRNEVQRAKGRFVNNTEAFVVVDIVKSLFRRYGNAAMDGNIAVIAPYRAQVENISATLNTYVPQLTRETDRALRDVKVCTVDSMQGSQRDIVIISITRSNDLGGVGFVQNSRRLNVSLTRARFLNIVIADYSTIRVTGKREGYGIPSLASIYRKCLARAEDNNACVARITPVRNRQYGQDFFTLSANAGSEPATVRGTQNARLDTDPDMVNDTPTWDFAGLFPEELDE